MITFETLSYKNFLSTGNTPTKIELNKSSATLVIGHNGAGKSTMLDALSFALFGKPHRNINKQQMVNSINNKNCEVEVEFSVGGNKYKVFRSIKPGKFQIFKNGELLNQESHTRDYQRILENNILKLNYKSFHQVVVLGSSSFVPFMQLPAGQRRNVIEDLLDIGIFTKMNSLTKERFARLKNEMNTTTNNINILNEKISLQEKHIKELKQIDINQAAKNEKKVKELESEIQHLTKANSAHQDVFMEEYPIATKVLKDYLAEHQEILSDYEHNKRLIHDVVKEAKFYENNHKCPTCTQTIDAKFKEHQLQKLKIDAANIQSYMDQHKKELDELGPKIEEARQKQDKVAEIQTTIRGNELAIKNLTQQVASLTSNTEVKSVDTTKAEAELKQNESELTELSGVLKSQRQVKSYMEAVFELLKDTGIKTKIIKQYLPVMNKLINQYLQILDFFVSFNLDESFNETIRSRHRDDFSYSSFSEGEKQRIDLSLLFAWRQVAKMKNSANTNLLILDETFDSSLDADGVDNLIRILHTFRAHTNVFIISHKQDMLDGKFPAKIEFKKHNNFSTATLS